MSNLEIKRVNFLGDELVAVRENDSGQVLVGIRWICDGLGLTENQRIHQTSKIQKDKALSKGVRKILLPTTGGEQESICLNVKLLLLWLAKLNANIVKDEYMQEKLVNYQLQCADALLEAFAPQLNSQADNDIISQISKSPSQFLFLLAEKTKEIEDMKPKAQAYDKFIDATNAQTWLQVSKVLGTGRTRLCKFLRQQEVLMDNNLPYQQFIDRGYFVTKEITAFTSESGAFNYTQTLVTAKGTSYISKLLDEQKLSKAN